MGAVIRDSTGAVWRVAVNQNVGCVEPEYVEAKVCKCQMGSGASIGAWWFFRYHGGRLSESYLEAKEARMSK